MTPPPVSDPELSAAQLAGLSASAQEPLLPRQADDRGKGAAFSLVAHLGLVAALAWGVAWHSPPPTEMSAELWAAVPQVAAPRAQAPEPEPAPPPPKPEPRPAPPPPPPKAVEREAEIALEKAKKLEQAKREQERQAEEDRKKRDLAQKKEAERLKAEKAKADQDKLDKQKRELADKQKKEREAQEKREREAEEAKLAKQREDNLQRLMNQLPSGQGAANARGTAQVDAAPSKSYAGLLVRAIKPNIVFSETVSTNPEAVVVVTTSPTGAVLGASLKKSSGIKAWDDAVLRAIERTAKLPKDEFGRVPPAIEMVFRPQD